MLEELPVNRKNVPYAIPYRCRFVDCNQKWVDVPTLEDIRLHFKYMHDMTLVGLPSRQKRRLILIDQ